MQPAPPTPTQPGTQDSELAPVPASPPSPHWASHPDFDCAPRTPVRRTQSSTLPAVPAPGAQHDAQDFCVFKRAS
eukprot:3365551-Lingulodinium_polyedra.AAC.1